MEGMNSNQRTMYITKTYKQRIKKTHPLYELFTDITIKSKNLYNLALYTERQYYFEHKKIISRFTLQTMLVEESYTSGTSFLDNELPIKENYNKSRRKYRGLFVTNTNQRINSDVNGAYQILKKVPAFAPYIQSLPTLEYNPIKINVA